MRRCRLISPTNLLLEHPILSPVEDCEYVLHGKKEFERRIKQIRIEMLQLGIAIGAVAMFLACALLSHH